MTKLRTAIRDLGDACDFAFIDTPPNLGLLLTAALTASTHVLIPVQAAPFALTGLRDLLQVIEDARELNPFLQQENHRHSPGLFVLTVYRRC